MIYRKGAKGAEGIEGTEGIEDTEGIEGIEGAQEIALSICIVNWNTREDLRRCLESILNANSRTTVEVIVVDNHSEDGSADMVRCCYPQVRLIENSKNIGFAAGNNQAMRKSRGRFLLLLNPDTVVQEGALDRMVEFMESHPQVGALGCKLINENGSLQYSCRSFPSLGAGFFRNTPLGRLFPQNRFTRDYLMSDFSHEEIREVDWVSGACLMTRRETAEQIGLLDEGYYMYCEDVDWCWQMRQAGWSVYYLPTAVVIHAVGRSSDQRMIRMIVQFHKSMLRFYLKNYRKRYPLVLFPLIAAGISLRCCAAVSKVLFQKVRGRWRHACKRIVQLRCNRSEAHGANAKKEKEKGKGEVSKPALLDPKIDPETRN